MKKMYRRKGRSGWIGSWFILLLLLAFMAQQQKKLTLDGVLEFSEWQLFHYAAVAGIIGLAIQYMLPVLKRRRKKRRYRQSGLYQIDQMSGSQFESFLRVYFQDLGYSVLPHKGGAGDRGADLILRSPQGEKVIVQAKRYKGKVPFSAVQQVHTAQSLYDADRALLISNYYLTKQAKETARSLGIEVWERKELETHLYINRKKKVM